VTVDGPFPRSPPTMQQKMFIVFSSEPSCFVFFLFFGFLFFVTFPVHCAVLFMCTLMFRTFFLPQPHPPHHPAHHCGTHPNLLFFFEPIRLPFLEDRSSFPYGGSITLPSLPSICDYSCYPHKNLRFYFPLFLFFFFRSTHAWTQSLFLFF